MPWRGAAKVCFLKYRVWFARSAMQTPLAPVVPADFQHQKNGLEAVDFIGFAQRPWPRSVVEEGSTEL
jgi:hypothetical protein